MSPVSSSPRHPRNWSRACDVAAFSSLLLLAVAALVLSAGGAADFAFPLQANSVRLAVIGDMGTGEQPQLDVAQQMVKSRAAFPFEFVITLGDNIYTGSQPSDFDKDFAVPYKPLLDAGVPFYATLGNHDTTNERFYKPFNMNGANYYTFKKGNVRFFALDSNYMDPKQLAWLETQLRDAGNGDWKICYFHHRAVLLRDSTTGPATDLRKVLEPLFVKYGVDVVFAGHDHVYERVHPQQGIYYFTEGASGSLRPGNLAPSAITAKGFDTDRSFLMIEFAGDDLYFQATSRTGVAVDSGVIHRTIRPHAGAGGAATVAATPVTRTPAGCLVLNIAGPGRVGAWRHESQRRSPTRAFDAQAFLDSAGVARRSRRIGAQRSIFSQGDAGDSVFYIQKGGVKLSVVSEIGQGGRSSRCSGRATSSARGVWRGSPSGWRPRPRYADHGS